MIIAKESNCDLVLTHHPLMLTPEKSIDFNKMPGKVIEIAAKQNINIVSAHTNLDKINDGLNDYFAAKIGLKKTKAFFPEDEVIGIGRIGSLKSQVVLEQVAHKVKEKLNLKQLRVIGNMSLPVKTIAVCTGSGGSLMDVFLKSDADLYITGDIKYHEARLVEESCKALIDVGHFASEHMAIDLLADKLSQASNKAKLNIQIKIFKNEKDPFTIV